MSGEGDAVDGGSVPAQPETTPAYPKDDGVNEGMSTDETVTMFLDCARYAEGDDVDILKDLLEERPAILFSADAEGRTALHLAAANGHLNICEILVAKGATRNARNIEGNTALHYACLQNHEKIVELLLKNGWLPHVTNNVGETPLRSIAEKKFEEIEVLLMKYDDKLDEYKVPDGSRAEVPDEEEEDVLDEKDDTPAPTAPEATPATASAAAAPANPGDANLDDVE